MFGLEKNKDGKGENAFVFDVEREWLDPEKLEASTDGIIKKTEQIKNMLRQGEKQEDYDKLGLLLYGYVGLLKTASQAGRKINK